MKKLQFKHGAKYLFGLIAVMYPVLVFCALVVFKLPIRYLSIGIIVFAIAYTIVNSRHYKGKHTVALFVSPLILCTIGVISLCIGDSPIFIKLYPALASIAYLTIMITSFIFPPPLAYYFVDIFDKKIKTKIPKEIFNNFCFRASVVWCVFFFVDAIIAVITVYFCSDIVWSIYNACITYCIMGLIFVGEFIVLKIKEKKYRREHPIADTQAGQDVNS
jgi:uncharacterized membrane protein